MISSFIEVSTRILLAIGGGYVASSACLAAFCAFLAATGLSHSEAVTLGTMLAFVLYLMLILWVFAACALWRPSVVFMLMIVVGYGTAFYFGQGG